MLLQPTYSPHGGATPFLRLQVKPAQPGAAESIIGGVLESLSNICKYEDIDRPLDVRNTPMDEPEEEKFIAYVQRRVAKGEWQGVRGTKKDIVEFKLGKQVKTLTIGSLQNLKVQNKCIVPPTLLRIGDTRYMCGADSDGHIFRFVPDATNYSYLIRSFFEPFCWRAAPHHPQNG